MRVPKQGGLQTQRGQFLSDFERRPFEAAGRKQCVRFGYLAENGREIRGRANGSGDKDGRQHEQESI
jgi:hypothetical protein